MNRRTELGDFLRSRRARLRPEDLGLPSHGGRRRVPGLRREELAQLAGVSADYYARMEQGRFRNVSEAILDAVADALRLTDDEHTHLLDLAGIGRVRRRIVRSSHEIRPAVRQMLDALDLPACIIDHRCDVLAWNRLFTALMNTEFDALREDQRNLAWLVFLDDTVAQLYVDWSDKARNVVGFLRMDAGRHPDDPRLAELIGKLSGSSAAFRELWADYHVRGIGNGRHRLRHPRIGEFTVAYETFRLTADPDQVLVSYCFMPGSPAKALLKSLTASE